MTRIFQTALAALVLIAPIAIPAPMFGQTPAKAEPARKALSSEELYEHTLKATCWVVMQSGSGTGWVLDKDKKLVVTNAHVVPDTDEVLVFFPVRTGDTLQTNPMWYKQNASPIRATVIDRDVTKDLALLKLASLPATATALPLAPASARQGQEIMTIGASTEGSQGLWGWVDGKVRNVVDSRFREGNVRRVESNIATNRGNSGGPVVNNKGEIVAVHHAAHPDAINVSYHIELSELNAFLAVAQPLVEPKTAAEFIARANRRMLQMRYAVARDDFSAALKVDPKSAQATLGRGMTHYYLNDQATAIADLNEALKLKPDYQQAFHFRGMAKFRKSEYEPAIEDFTQSIRLNAKSFGSFNERGRCYYELKKYSDAQADFSRAIELSPTNPVYWQNRGLAKEKQGEVQGALDDMAKGIEASPQNPVSYTKLGYMLFRAERYDDAMKAHFKADELDVKNPLHAENVGHCLKMQEKFDAAIRLFNLALERAQKYQGDYKADTCLCSRGFCKRRLQNYDASLADHNLSLKINAKNAETYYQRAWTYRWMGHYDLAKEDFDKSIELDSSYAKKEAPVVTSSGYSFYPGFRIRR